MFRFSPRSGLARPRSLPSAASGAVVTAVAAAIVAVVAVNRRRLPGLRENHGCRRQRVRCYRCSVSPAWSAFGAVVAAVPAFAIVRDWVLSIGGRTRSSRWLSRPMCCRLITGSASGWSDDSARCVGGVPICALAAAHGIDPALLDRIARDESGDARQLAAERRGSSGASFYGSVAREKRNRGVQSYCGYSAYPFRSSFFCCCCGIEGVTDDANYQHSGPRTRRLPAKLSSCQYGGDNFFSSSHFRQEPRLRLPHRRTGKGAWNRQFTIPSDMV